MTELGTTELERALGSAVERGDLSAATRLLLERAEHEKLIDVGYATMDSPYGELTIAATERGVVRLGLPNRSQDEVLEEIAATISPRMLELPARLDPARRQLEAYFERRLDRFDVPIDWQLAEGFRGKVLHAIAKIPYGRTLSYGEVAARAGNPRAYRAAGSACGSNPVPLIVPCHRVVQASGEPGNYGGGPEMKKALLELEGVI